jgi:hypothetical protein
MVQQRHLAPPTYLVAAALIVIPPFDALMQVLPLRIHDARWRFGFVGLSSNALMIPVVGLLIAFVGASYFEHRAVQRVLGFVSIAIAAFILISLGFFVLDALQVKQSVAPAAILAFKVASVTAVLKSILGLVTLGAFALASFRTPRPVAPAKGQRGAELIIGAKPIARPSAASLPVSTQGPEDAVGG